jgi:hypothetical protein
MINKTIMYIIIHKLNKRDYLFSYQYNMYKIKYGVCYNVFCRTLITKLGILNYKLCIYIHKYMNKIRVIRY